MDGLEYAEFAQSESLATRIANILQDYPFGSHSLYEFVQNADDAGATKFAIVLDFSGTIQPEASSSGGENKAEAELEGSEGYFTAAVGDRLEQTVGRLWVYNDATFSEDDFQSIIRLGLSAKREDSSKVGKYGLGFNVSYHFSDLVTFLSGRSLVMFDPKGAYLKGGMHGIRTDFVKERISQRYAAQMEATGVVKDLFQLSLEDFFEGTLFELPLYPPGVEIGSDQHAQLRPKESLSEAFMLKMLGEFQRSAPTLLLFLQSIEEISLYSTQHGKVVPLSTVKLKDLSAEERQQRKVLHSSDGSSVTREEPMPLTVEELTGDSSRVTQWKLHSAYSREPELVHACIATQWQNEVLVPVDGEAFSFLPLGVKTSLPVHVNANFALTSNRRNVWTTQGDARWEHNAFLLEKVIPEVYLGFLAEAMKTVEQTDFNLWPCNASAPFDLMSSSLMGLVFNPSSAAKVFRYGNKTVSFESILVEDTQFSRSCSRGAFMRDALASCGRVPVCLPEQIRILLHKLELEYRTTTIDVVLDVLKPVQWTDSLVDQVIRYCLPSQSRTYEQDEDGTARDQEQDAMFRKLHGLPIIPLYGGKHGIFRYPFNGANKEQSYLICHPDVQSTLSDCARLVDLRRVPAFARIMDAPPARQANIYRLSANSLIDMDLMEYFIPKEWANKELIYFSSKNRIPSGCVADHILALDTAGAIRQLIQSGPPSAVIPKSKRKLKKERKQQAKAQRGKRNGKTTGKAEASRTTVKVVEAVDNEKVTASLVEEHRVDTAKEGEVEKKLQLLWQIIESSPGFHTRNLQRFAKFPIVRCEDYVMTIEAAVKRIVLPLQDFSDPDEVKLLRSLGLLFIDGSGKRLSEALVHRRSDVVRAVAETVGRALTVQRQVVVSHEHCIALRALLLRYIEGKTVQVPATSVRSLPVFCTMSGSFTAASTFCGSMRIDQDIGLETTQMKVASCPGTSNGPWEETSNWEGVLPDVLKQRALSYMSDVERKMLYRAALPRSDEVAFLFEFIVPFLQSPGIKELSLELSMEILETVGRLRLWQVSKKDPRGNRIMATMSSCTVVMDVEGQLRKCSDFIDPSNKTIVNLMGSSNSYAFPPEAYSSNDACLVALKNAGLRSLNDASVFLEACAAVETGKNVQAGRYLLDYFVKNWGKTIKLNANGWSPAILKALAKVRFVPSVIINSVIPWEVETPSLALHKSVNDRRWNLVQSNVRSRKRTGKLNTQAFIQDTLEAEQTGASYFHQERHIDAKLRSRVDQLYQAGVKLIKEGKMAFRQAKQSRDKNEYIFVGFSDTNDSVVLHHYGWQCWQVCGVFPKVLSTAPTTLLQQFDLCQPTSKTIAKSLIGAADAWRDSEAEWRLKNIKILQGIVLSSCSLILETVVRQSRHSHALSLIGRLSHTPFVVLDDGSLCTPSDVFINISNDLGEETRALPSYLHGLEELFVHLGAPHLKDVRVPVPFVSDTYPVKWSRILSGLRSAFNKPAMADVVFIVCNEHRFYAHKLVLSIVSEYFNTMFTSGLKESANGAVVEIELREVEETEGFELFLQYVYSIGSWNQRIQLKPTEHNLAKVLTMLLLADKYLLQHLKQLCETWLCKPAHGIINVYNVCGLLTHAVGCSAQQLINVCLFHIRNLFEVVSKLDSYEELDSSMKDLVLRNMRKSTRSKR